MKHHKSFRAILLAGAGAALLTGCSFIPAYERPTMELPATWQETYEADSAALVAYDWWTSFNEPELNRLMDEALAHNHDLKAGLHRITQARAALKISGASLLPTADGSAGANRSYTNPAQGKSSNATSLSAGLSVSYELDLFGGNRADIAASRASLIGTQFDQDALALVTMGDVASTYFTLLNLRERLTIADNNLDNSRDVLRIIEARVREGLESDLELAQQKRVVANSEASRESLVEQITNAENALAVLTAQNPSGFMVAGSSLENTAIPAIAPGQPSTLLGRRPDLRAAEAALTGANADIGAARSAFFPSLSLGLGETLSTTGFGDPSASVLSLASSLATPIFQGGRLKGGLDQANARQLELVENYYQAVLEAFQEVEDALAAVKAARTREISLETAMIQARKAYRLSKSKYDAGAIDFQTLLDTQDAQLTAEDTFSQAKLARLNAAIDLYKALGGSWEQQNYSD